jgi:hypothetical protein
VNKLRDEEERNVKKDEEFGRNEWRFGGTCYLHLQLGDFTSQKTVSSVLEVCKDLFWFRGKLSFLDDDLYGSA